MKRTAVPTISTESKRKQLSDAPKVVRDSTMSHYYREYYPFDTIFAAYAQTSERGLRREIAFWLGNSISRWRPCGESAAAFADAVRRSNPDRVEVGSLYDCAIKDRELYGKHGMEPIERELVFDIDLDESFDPLRSCGCVGKQYCRRCWPLMTASASLLDMLLHKMYGFRRLLWVYSGRRGMHCWCFDQPAQSLSAAARAQIVQRIDDVRALFNNDFRCVQAAPLLLVPGFMDRVHALFREHLDRNPNLFAYTPSGSSDSATRGRSAFDVCVSLIDQVEDVDAFRRLVNGSVVKSSSKKKDKPPNALQIWDQVCRVFSATRDRRKERYVNKIALHFCFPRLDRNVTESMKHLLKFPFCVHPSTGHVCVAVAPDKLERFYPDNDSVPNVNKLCGVDGEDAVKQHRELFERAVRLLKSEIS